MKLSADTKQEIAALAGLGVAAMLPLLSLAAPGAGAFLGHRESELPVKLWLYDTFARVGWLGGRIDVLSWPTPGLLNNPDPVGTVVIAALRPLFGLPGAFNTLIVLQLWATLAGMYLLVRALLPGGGSTRYAAIYAALSFGLTPLILSYCVASAITDMLNLWPYPVAVWGALRALQAGDRRAALLGGLAGGFGFVSCPYNFVVFELLLFPLLAGVAWDRRGRLGLLPPSLSQDTPAAPLAGWRAVAGALALYALAGALAAGPYALWMQHLMSDGSSQLGEVLEDTTRHRYPYPALWPDAPEHYIAVLKDYVDVGKGAALQRVAASRFFQVFSPGWSLFALALAGVALAPKARGRWVWAAGALFAMAASTGPYGAITPKLALPSPQNWAWLVPQAIMPGAKLLLEPFRYGLAVAFCLAIGGAAGLYSLALRVGPRAYAVAIAAWMIELVVLSPVPLPLPTASFAVSSLYRDLGQSLPPGAILELPYFDKGSERMVREHFLHQLHHKRPIPDEVAGLPPRYMEKNQFLAKLLAQEKPTGSRIVVLREPDKVEADKAALAQDGFAAILVDARYFQGTGHQGLVIRTLTEAFGPPERIDGRYLFRIPQAPAQAPPPAPP